MKALVAILLALAALHGWAQSATRAAVHYVIPDGYVGWLRVDYGVNAAHAPGYGVKESLPLPTQRGTIVVAFPASGHAVTSSEMQYGSAADLFSYCRNGSLVALSQAHDTGMIWSKFNGRVGGSASQTELFFVGTADEYAKFGNRQDPVPKHGPLKPLPPQGASCNPA